ncbi:hypothetical protein CSKR_108386 [Clonorchis sinensis]|uniref:Uncharacterized protein n=1 Tax=Clonorchis sinensis TaxID=79923 RepID=A0A3R7FWT9_CLOSI|nr:hypothetical protein CSKR_108386 [Clonorchis sinensis]
MYGPYTRNALLIRLLKILRQPTTGFALLGAHQDCFLWKSTIPSSFKFFYLSVVKFIDSVIKRFCMQVLAFYLFTMGVSTRTEILKLYHSLGESAIAALRGYKTKHGIIKDPFTVSTITGLIAKFESIGSVLDFPGKGRKSLSDERTPIVQNAVEQLQSQSTMASSSITQVSQLTGIPRASVHRIMRRDVNRQHANLNGTKIALSKRNLTLIGSLKTFRQPTAILGLLGNYQVGAVSEILSTLCST